MLAGVILFCLLPSPRSQTFYCFSGLKNTSVSILKGYRSTLTSVFKYRLPELQDSFVFRDLISSFELEHPRNPVGPPSWDLVKVLAYLRSSVFEPLP